MNIKELCKAGLPKRLLTDEMRSYLIEMAKNGRSDELLKCVKNPERYAYAADFKFITSQLINYKSPLRNNAITYTVFGREHIEERALRQMSAACKLAPVVGGAVMPDAHVGYGVPIGAVLVTEGAIIPGAVGVDIGCGMMYSQFDAESCVLQDPEIKQSLIRTLNECTYFGPRKNPLGGELADKYSGLFDDPAWEIPVMKRNKKLAISQLGTSGGGNHFVEFGETEDLVAKGIPRRLSVLSHSGSRGIGKKVAEFYMKEAKKQLCGVHPMDLPNEYGDLAWLDLDSQLGREYVAAMTVLGEYAMTNHLIIHVEVKKALEYHGIQRTLTHYNFHNFAWVEGNEVIHRKGATPAHKGDTAIIPGSMGTPAYIVEGLGNDKSYCSSSHGAGRLMSRKAAKETFIKEEMDEYLRDTDIHLISGGLDECPFVYKDIEMVIDEQLDLITPIKKFYPKIVKMGE